MRTTMTRVKRLKVSWTEEEDEELRRIYAMSHAGRSAAALRKLAVAKGVRLTHCRNRASTLGLARVAGGRRRWTQAEIENLRAYAGELTVRRIARILGRTESSVTCRLHLMELSGRAKDRGYLRYQLADLMGVDLETLRKLLKRFPMKTNVLGNFSESDVQLWIFDHLEELELRKFNQDWLKTMLKGAA